ncbi:hypothetical protein KWH85_22855, partial [Klebsiella aerogenes]|nr:hypothetical protein [Klebsiella aerogenes]
RESAGMNNEIELTAALATIEKCRELTNCPAGVDLQDWVKQLAAENLAQKNRTQQLIDIINNADNAYCMCGDAMKNHTYGGCGHPTGMFDYHYGKWLEHGNETPATDRIVAEAEARGVEKFAAKLRIPGDDQFFDAVAEGVAGAADAFAKQLREGADK